MREITPPARPFGAQEHLLRPFFMWFPDPAVLTAATAPTQFIALRWHEYFDGFTTDSFQPRLCSLPTLVEEMAEAAHDLALAPQFQGHYNRVREELADKLGGLVEQSVCSSKERYLLSKACHSDDPAFVRDTTTHILQDGFRSEYESRLLDLGQPAIIAAIDAKKPAKGAAETWLGAWATLALHREYMGRDDRIIFDDVLLKHSADSLLTEIRQKLVPTSSEYDCVLELRLSPAVLSLAVGQQADVMQQLHAIARKAVGDLPPQDIVGHPSTDRLLIHRRVQASGASIALANFCAQIQPALNLLNLYRNSSTTVPLRDGWVGRSLTDLKLMPIREATLQKLHPRKKAADLTLSALTERDSVRGVDPEVANALELYHVAMTTEDRRVRFLTLWSAMECLGQTVDGANILDRVTLLAARIVTWRRIEKHLRYLAISFKFARDRDPALQTTQCAGLPNATANMVFVEDILEAVSKKNGDPIIADLCKHASRHSLLVWRVKVAWDTFHSPKALSDDLATSRRRVEWQLGRIYRARNTLVHRGNDTVLLGHLTNNLQYYFSTTISRLLHGLAEKTDRSARQAAFRWCAHADYVMESLTSDPSRLTIADLLPSPERGHRIQIWPTSIAPTPI